MDLSESFESPQGGVARRGALRSLDFFELVTMQLEIGQIMQARLTRWERQSRRLQLMPRSLRLPMGTRVAMIRREGRRIVVGRLEAGTSMVGRLELRGVAPLSGAVEVQRLRRMRASSQKPKGSQVCAERALEIQT
ncbi:unnamed protein product [Symbiodinium sp. KB8]|nr:unnamed protein product [Symbiodinium sp. KB8]